jgi:repressor LexA
MKDLTPRQRQILEFVDEEARNRGYPPSVREIGKAVGLTSTSTVHAHLSALVAKGYLQRDPTKPRALNVQFEPSSGSNLERRPVRHVPLVGDVAAGTGVLAAENVEEVLPFPADFTGEGPVFMLRVRGESMIEAGIPGEEATVKTFSRKGDKIVLRPANAAMVDLVFRPDEVQIYGKVVSLLRRY